jgi:hypothetical protein
VVTIAAFVSGEVSRGLYRLGGLAAWWFIFVLGTWALWLYHGGRPAEVDRLVPLKWKVVLGALPAAALCVAIVVCFVQGRF